MAAFSATYGSPLEELKDLLKRTSRVEKALSKLESTTPEEETEAQTPDRSRERPFQASKGCYYKKDQVVQQPEEDQPYERESAFWEQQPVPLQERPPSQQHIENRPGATSKTQQQGSAQPRRTLNRTKAAPAMHATKGIPRTPLACSLAKLQQSEEQWLKEKVQLRREADQQRKRANAVEYRYSQLQALYKHQGTELKGVKVALQERDARLEDLEKQVRKDHEEATRYVEACEMQIQSLKDERQELQQLLSAALQQLQQAGDIQSSDLSDKQAAELAEARLHASEARQKQRKADDNLRQQANTFDKLLEVQLSHNRQKADALRSALQEDHGSGH